MQNLIKTIKPQKLKKGDRIGLVCPAGFITKEQLDKTSNILSELGFNSFFSDNILNRQGYLAGNDKERAEDINQMFINKSIKAILAVRGGYGSSRIIDLIDYQTIKENPKIFIGYSDITALLNSINKFTGLITFHGIVGISDFNDYTKQNFLNLFVNNLLEIKSDENISPKIINHGSAQGKLAGGNLSTINSLLATDFEIDFTDKIVFIEDISESPYKIDRMLTQLLLSGNLKKAKAIILGVFKNCDLNDDDINKQNSLSLQEIFIDRLNNLNIPVISNFSFGHIESQAIFPIGITAEINTNELFIRLLEKPFS
ncbi:MAG: LD-carboxypeptidase [Bacteroidales bacterium]|nr:LD-carboxypeptidase [Bacteroidales bacterium]MBN2757782.1 LD-carboxypeptidase [Bacteroidales bacterium]